MKNYKVKEVADRYNVTVFTVYAWMRDGKLPHSVVHRGMRACKIITHEHLLEMESKTETKPMMTRVVDGLASKDPDHLAWVKRYRSLIGANPPRFDDWVMGNLTFDEMKSDLIRAAKIISE